MKATIVNYNINTLIGKVETKFGVFTAKIIGDTIEENKVYNVEITIDGKIKIETDNNMDEGIYDYNGSVFLKGIVDSADEDGVCYLRFGDDLVMIDCDVSENEGKQVILSTSSVSIYTF